MNRLRVPLVVVLVLVLQTALVYRLRVSGVTPDTLLLLAVCAGIVGGPERGAVVGFAAGFAIDLFLQTTPVGLSALVFSLLAYAVGIVAEGTVRAAAWIPVVTAGVASAVGVVAFALVAALVAGADFVSPHLATVAVLVGLFNGALAPLFLRLATWAVGRHTRTVMAP